MSRVIGIEIGAGHLKAVVRRGRRALQTYEQPFSADDLPGAVVELQAQVGDVAGIGLAIGLAHLHVKQVKLPPVPHLARRQMLMMEPERWFAVRSGAPTAIALDTTGVIALGADGAFVDACVEAFAAWAPVQRVEASPMALARALIAAGQGTGIATLDAGPGEVGLVQLDAGVLRSVRRVRATDLTGELPAMLTLPDLDGAFAVAHGAARSFDGAIDAMLLTPSIEREFVSAQRRRFTNWSVAAMAAVGLMVWSVSVSRSRLLDTLTSEVAAARDAATEGNASVARALTIDRELAAITTTTSDRADALASLAALGARLPVEAVAQRVRMVGNEWQVEGNATTASAVLAAFAAEPGFEKVRFLAPSNRFRDGADDRETFAIAFVVR